MILTPKDALLFNFRAGLPRSSPRAEAFLRRGRSPLQNYCWPVTAWTLRRIAPSLTTNAASPWFRFGQANWLTTSGARSAFAPRRAQSSASASSAALTIWSPPTCFPQAEVTLRLRRSDIHPFACGSTGHGRWRVARRQKSGCLRLPWLCSARCCHDACPHLRPWPGHRRLGDGWRW